VGAGGADAGDANVWIGTGATYYDKIASGLAQASEGDVIDTRDGNLYRAIDDSGTLRAVRPEVYEGTSPAVDAYIDGDEANDAALVAQGWDQLLAGPSFTRGTGSVTYDGTHVTLAYTSAGGANGAILGCLNGIGNSDGIYFAGRCTWASLANNYLTGMAVYTGDYQGMVRSSLLAGGAVTANDTTARDFSIVTSSPATEVYAELLVEPGASGAHKIWIDGVLVHVSSRSAGAVVGLNRAQLQADNNNLGIGSASLALRNVAVWAYT
jgi:hypothetical protein